ncbi:uncharacterized protein LOC143285946 [Babylonia areolata]|uniref:uncharacterized protein LOC143285946 n=1 Tax=Babylonia areolata TaxID=304850 RepID=UPI003FD68B34
MRRLPVHPFLFLWLRAHLLWPPHVSQAARRVEIVCGDFSTMGRDSDVVVGGDIDVTIRHPAMVGNTVDLVEGMEYEVTFSSGRDVTEVQGVAMLTYNAGERPPDLPSWPSPYRCHPHRPSPPPLLPPSPVQTTPSSPLADPTSDLPRSDHAGIELLTSEVDVTPTLLLSSYSSTSSSSSSSSSGQDWPKAFSSSPDGESSPLHTSSPRSPIFASLSEVLQSSSSSSFSTTSSSSTSAVTSSSASSSSVSTPELTTSPPGERLFSKHLPFSLPWTAGSLSAPCLTLAFVIRVNSSAWVLQSQELCQPQGCRQYFTAETGVLHSPGYPSNYPDSSDCTYTIYTRTDSAIELQFQMFHLEQSYSDRCVDSVTVSDSGSLKRVLCGDYDVTQLRHLRFVSAGNTMVIRFVSDNKFSSGGFRAVYAITRIKACDDSHHHLNGTIRSPANSPSGTYLPNTLCRHSIHLPAPFRIRFYLRFLNFSDLLTASCSHGDFLHFRDRDSHNEATVTCYSDVTRGDLLFESSGSRVDMVFASDHVYEGRGFEVFYVGVPSCKNETYTQLSGSVSSVNFPGFYPNMQECFYTVNVTSPQRHDNVTVENGVTTEVSDIIEVTFGEFSTESDSAGDARLRDGLCVRDFVEIHAEGDARHRVCGNWAGKERLLYFRFRSDFVSFRFVTDEQGTRRGFNATWRLLRGDNHTACLSTLLTTQHLAFQVIHRAETWADGQTDCESRGGMLASILSNNTQHLLNQHLLSQTCQRGDLTYWIGANDRDWESDFYWADRSKVTFTNWFPGFARGGGQGGGRRYGRQPSDDGQADEDCVELRRHFALPDKGHTSTATYFWNDRNCAQRNPYVCQIQPQTSTPQRIQCDRNLTLSPLVSELRLHSPGYPHDPYPDHTRCTLFLHAPPAAILEVEFWDFQLENGSDPGRCDYDYVDISTNPQSTDAPDVDDKRCGDWSGKVKLLRQVVTSFYAFLRFRADHSKRFRGFDLTVRMLQGQEICLNDSWVPIQTGCLMVIPEQVHLQTAQHHCSSALATVWTATFTEADILVTLSRLLAAEEELLHDTAESTHVVVFDSEGAGCLSLSVAASVVIDHVAVVTEVLRSRVSCDAVGTYACFRPRENQTKPQHIFIDATTETEGRLQPPLDDDDDEKERQQNYTNNAAVTWTLEAGSEQRLLLMLSGVDVEHQEDCLYDSIQVSNTTPAGSLCGSLLQGWAAVSWGQSAEVTFRSDYSITGPAFTLAWQTLNMTQCRNTVFRENSASLSSFNYPRPFPDTVHCLVTVQVEEGQRVLLEFSTISFRDASRAAVRLDLGEGGGGGLVLDTTWLGPNTSTTLLSPNYPHRLPDLLSVTYTLSAPIGYMIHVTFHHFLLPRSSDVVEVYDVSILSEEPQLLLRLCGGDSVNDTLVSRLNSIQNTWCQVPSCHGRGACQLTDSQPGYRCLCHPGYFGARCQMNGSQCRRQLCHGAGECEGNSSHAECPYCNVTVHDQTMSKTIGQRLLGEPIWIGLIVILSVLVFFGILCLVRRRCAKRYACCQLQFKRKEPGERGASDTRRGGRDAGAHPLTTFHLRRQLLRPPSSASTTPRVPRTTPMISVTKADDDSSAPAPAPPASRRAMEELKAEVAARFFASYREAERAPISTPLPKDFSKTTDTFLAQTSDESTVGAIVGGTLLHDLHQRKSREDLLSRSSLSLGPPRRRSSSTSSHGNRERIRRCHSMGGALTPRQESHSGGEGAATSPLKSLSVEERDAHSLCSDRDTVFSPSPAEFRSLSASPSMQRRLAQKLDFEGVRVCVEKGREGGGGGPQHLFPEVIVHSVHGGQVDCTNSDSSHLTSLDLSPTKPPSAMDTGHLLSVRSDSAFGTMNHSHSERELSKHEEECTVTEDRVQSGTTLRYKDERPPVFHTSASRQSLDELKPSSRRKERRQREAEDNLGELSAHRRGLPRGEDDRRQLFHQNTVDSYLRHKSRSPRTHKDSYLRSPRGLGQRSCTSPVQCEDYGDRYGEDRYHAQDKRRARTEGKLKPEHERNKQSAVEHRSRYSHDQDQRTRPGDSPKHRAKHGSKQQSARDRRGVFKRNETISAAVSWQSRRSRSKRRGEARSLRKCSSVDFLDSDRRPAPSRSHSDHVLDHCHCEDCVVRETLPASSTSSRYRAESDMGSSSSGRHYKQRGGRDRPRKGRRDMYSREDSSGARRLTHVSGPFSARGQELRSLKTSSSDNERFFETSSTLDRSSSSSWDDPEHRHRGIEALGSSTSDKDMDVSQRELFMKFFSQEVDLDDNLSPEEPRFFLGPEPDSLEIVTHVEQQQHDFEDSEHHLESHTQSLERNPYLPHTSEPKIFLATLEDDRETLAITSSYPQLPHSRKKSNMLTSTCSVIMYDDDLRAHSGTRSLSVSNNVSPKRTIPPSDPPRPPATEDLHSVVIKVENSATPAVPPDQDSSSASSEVIPPPHSDPTSLLSVTDTDSAVSSAASRQTSPCSDVVYTSSGSGVTQSQAPPRAMDSAYQTKESSMDIFDTSRDSRRRKSLPTSRDDRKVTQRLQQAAVKLYILQQRVRKGHLSRDSAVNTISEDETGPDGEDLPLTHGSVRVLNCAVLPSRHRRQMTLPEGRGWAEKGGEERGIREEEEHESDLDLPAGLNPTPEILPATVENILEEPVECRGEYEA